MNKGLHFKTVAPLLLRCLNTLMQAGEFRDFRLVGGTALSLYRGHRVSIDIDLFTDAPYDSINFDAIDSFLRTTYPYVDTSNFKITGMGKSYFVGENKNECIKLDLYYTDDFIQNVEVVENIRLASVEEIVAMKVDVVFRGGRKKDFWDLHELIDEYTLETMLSLHEKRYPYNHDRIVIKNKFSDFQVADLDFDPVCLRNKHWEIIKLDLIDFSKS